MKKLISLIGVGIFWLLWPGWYLYFKFWPERSRILVVVGDEVLLLKIWISAGRYGLPGGGKKRNETNEQCAVRELIEETGVSVPESALEFIGKKRQSFNGLNYQTFNFVLRLDEKPAIRSRPFEILQSRWVEINEAEDFNIDKDVRFAIKRYKPITQETLL